MSAINKFERRTTRKGVVRAGEQFTFLISNEDKIDFIKILKSLDDSDGLIDGHTQIV